MDRVKKETSGKKVSLVYDGTTHVAEALVIILRFITDELEIHQRVCRLKLLAKSLSGDELAHQIISCLSTDLSIPCNLLVAAMRDRASVNRAAMRTVKVVYSSLLDIGCMSHTLDHVGEHMHTPILDKFIKAWIALFACSPKAKLAWRTTTGFSAPSYSATRWWSKFEVIHQVLKAFGDILPSLKSDNLPPASSDKLLEIISDLPMQRKLQMEMAVTVGSMEPFVKACYSLEGDGPLALTTYEQIHKLFFVLSMEYYPNIAKSLSNGNS